MYTKSDILDLIEEEDIRFIRLQFTDLMGHMRNIAVTTTNIDKILESGCVFDGSAVDGYARLCESDMFLKPNLNTFVIFPWRPHQGKVARFICDLYTPEGKLYVNDPRYILKRVINEAAEMGLTFKVGPECEFFLFKTDDSGNPLLEPSDNGGYFDLAPMDSGENCRREICLTLEDMGYRIEASHHEVTPGQHEIDFAYDEALTTADRIITFKTVVKTVANRHGYHATFMPKPLAGMHGSGMHLNMSLFRNGENIFYEKDAPDKLSETAHRFIAGLIKYTPDMFCLTNPIVNSYKRLIPGFEAPCYIGWSRDKGSPLIRVPASRDAESARIELRSPDGTANPYLALAACLKAGLEGIRQELVPPSSIEINLHDLNDEERRSLGIEKVPISLNEAVKCAEKSEFFRELLGDKMSKQYLWAKKEEYARYSRTINPWEVDEYLIKY